MREASIPKTRAFKNKNPSHKGSHSQIFLHKSGFLEDAHGSVFCFAKNSPSTVRSKLAPKGNFCRTCGAPGETRTHDLQLRRLTLYPSELRARMGGPF